MDRAASDARRNVVLATETIEPAPLFLDLGISPDLNDVLAGDGIVEPFPIQALTIPDALAGLDVCGRAQTGSGKTLAFGLPTIERISRALPSRPSAMVIVPTRELAAQVAAILAPLAAVRSQRVLAVYGVASLRDQIKALGAGVEVIVATPARLIDLLDRGQVQLDRLEVVVIDEADEMADLGFLPQVQSIMRRVTARHQTMLFSATLDHRVQVLVRNYMKDPVFHNVQSSTVTVETSEHRFLEVQSTDKARVTARIASGTQRTLVFVRTKRNCDRVAGELKALGVKASAIHGDMPQPSREQTLRQFRRGRVGVLVATNVAARGLDIEGVDVVVHYDLPEDSTTYLHRSGRTARAGEEGLVVTLVVNEQLETAGWIMKEAGLLVPVVKMYSNDPRLDDLGGWDPGVLAPIRRSAARSRRRQRLL
ncbi:MAG: DEAD/DEAH box helicase [Actinomycetota bacterium]